MSERIIEAERSLIIACDMPFYRLKSFVTSTAEVDGVSGYKIGIEAALGLGLGTVADIVKRVASEHRVLFDAQKAGTDIADTAPNFARVLSESYVDAAFLYPRINKSWVAERWTKELQDHNIGVITGSEMTDDIPPSPGTPYEEDPFIPVFAQAINLGVRDFGVPANKPDRVAYYRNFFEQELGEDGFALYGIGIGAQEGSVESFMVAAGSHDRHVVIGRAIAEAANVKVAAEEYSRKLAY